MNSVRSIPYGSTFVFFNGDTNAIPSSKLNKYLNVIHLIDVRNSIRTFHDVTYCAWDKKYYFTKAPMRLDVFKREFPRYKCEEVKSKHEGMVKVEDSSSKITYILSSEPAKNTSTKTIDSSSANKTISSTVQDNGQELIDVKADFLVRAGAGACYRKGHDIEEIAIVIPVIEPGAIPVKVEAAGFHCRTCNKYYISNDEFERVSSYGMINCPVVTNEYFAKMDIGKRRELRSESLLHSLGYCVSADGPDDIQRQFLLSLILDRKLMKKDDIVNMLTFLIWLNGSHGRNPSAVKRRKNDFEFVNSYKLGSRKHVTARSFRIRKIR